MPLSEECGCVTFLVALPLGALGLRAFFAHMHLGDAQKWHSSQHALYEHPVVVLLSGFLLVAAGAVLLAGCLENLMPASKRKQKRDKVQ